MARYKFDITIIGRGTTVDDAWEDAQTSCESARGQDIPINYKRFDDDDGDKTNPKSAPNPIVAAFSCPNDWRTVRGIAHWANMPEEDVRSYLDSHPELFECSPTEFLGQKLYRTKGKG